MKSAAERLDFEAAIEFRDTIEQLKLSLSKDRNYED
jgi:excinuclease UvrABC helicase subunit UvrB